MNVTRSFKLVCVLLLLSLLFSGCTRILKFEGREFNKYKNQLMKEYKGIDSIVVEFYVPLFRFEIYVSNKISEKDAKEIFLKTRDFISSESFQKSFFKKYSRIAAEKYPLAQIHIRQKGQTTSAYSFESSIYSVPGDTTSDKSKNYKTWRLGTEYKVDADEWVREVNY